MRKIVLSILFLNTLISYSQDSKDQLKQNELSSNLFDLVVAGSFSVNYERLFENNQSFLVSATFFDTYSYLDAGYIERSEAFSLKASYMIYFKKEKDHAGFYFNPLLKARTGKVYVDDVHYC